MNKLPTNLSGLAGSGGGGKGGSAPTEVADNRFSDVIAKVLIAYSYGTTDGLLRGRKSIYLDETQLEADSGSDNFAGVTFAESDGTVLTDGSGGSGAKGGSKGGAIAGFSQATSVIAIGVDVEQATPVIRTVSAIDVDAVRIIITIPALQNIEEDGDIKGSSVQLRHEVRDVASGLWEDRGIQTITGKSSGAFQRQYTLVAPDTVTAAWDWRVTRITADSASARLSNDTVIQAAVEVFYGKEDYLGTAAVGVAIDTADFGNSIPSIAFEVGGVNVKVPSNYTVSAGIPDYAGIWDGTFKLMSTSNPVWHLYHLLTNDEAGLGLPDSFIDRYNFYDVARYNDAVNLTGDFVGVSDGEGGLRRRFTLNTQIRGQQEGLKMCQEIASSMRAILYFGAGAVVLKQDAPRDTARIVTNENVQNGHFAYSSTQAKDRITVAKVGYNDPDDFFKLKYTVYPAQADWATDVNIARYGRNEIDITKFGCASEAEAYAFAKWIVYASCNENKTVTFIGNMEFLLTRPGDIIEVADRRLAGAASFDQRLGGRIAGGTSTTVVLDYPVTLAVGETYEITIIGADGITLEKRNITTASGTDITTVTVDAVFTALPTVGFTWLITGTDIAPQKFSVINVERKDGLEVEVFALNYVEGKYDFVEEGTAVVAKPYSRIDTAVVAPTNLTWQLVPRYDAANNALNSLLVRWTASTSEYASRYEAFYRKDFGNLISAPITSINEIEIPNVSKGQYEVFVYAVNPLGVRSIPLTDSYVVEYGTGSPVWDGVTLTMLPPTITNGPAFTGKDLEVQWTRNALNDIPGIVFKEYVVDFYVGATLQRTITTTNLKTTYYYDDMVTDQGENPSRTINVEVRERETFNRESASATLTFTNAAPASTTFTVNPGFTTAFIDIALVSDPDVAGYYVFRSETAAFTPAIGNVVFKGGPNFTDSGLVEGTTYYYNVAAFDLFDDTIANLNLATEASVTAVTVAGSIVNYDFEDLEFSVAGSVVSWTAGTVYTDLNGTVSTTAIALGNDTWTSGTLYFYWDPLLEVIATETNIATLYQSGENRRIVATFDGAIIREGTNKLIIDGADIIAETIGATQVVTSGLITNTAQISNGIIETANIKDLTVERIKIASNAITQPANAVISGFGTVGMFNVGDSSSRRFQQFYTPRNDFVFLIDDAAGDEPEEVLFTRIGSTKSIVRNRYVPVLTGGTPDPWVDGEGTISGIKSCLGFFMAPGGDLVTKNPNMPAPTSAVATGALSDTTVTHNGESYREVIWSGSGSLAINGGALRGVEYTMIGGGAGGGYDGGGGGAGGVITNDVSWYTADWAIVLGDEYGTNTTQTITVGAAGAGSTANTAPGGQGGDTTITLSNNLSGNGTTYPTETRGYDTNKLNLGFVGAGSETNFLGDMRDLTAQGGSGGGSPGYDPAVDFTGFGYGLGFGVADGGGGGGSTFANTDRSTGGFGSNGLAFGSYQASSGGAGFGTSGSHYSGGGGGTDGDPQLAYGKDGASGVVGAGGDAFEKTFTNASGVIAKGGNGGNSNIAGVGANATGYGGGGNGGNNAGNGGAGTSGLVVLRWPVNQEALRPPLLHLLATENADVAQFNDSIFFTGRTELATLDQPSTGTILERVTNGGNNWNTGDSIVVKSASAVYSLYANNTGLLVGTRPYIVNYVKFYR